LRARKERHADRGLAGADEPDVAYHSDDLDRAAAAAFHESFSNGALAGEVETRKGFGDHCDRRRTGVILRTE
jgi:hypothetical protein